MYSRNIPYYKIDDKEYTLFDDADDYTTGDIKICPSKKFLIIYVIAVKDKETENYTVFNMTSGGFKRTEDDYNYKIRKMIFDEIDIYGDDNKENCILYIDSIDLSTIKTTNELNKNILKTIDKIQNKIISYIYIKITLVKILKFMLLIQKNLWYYKRNKINFNDILYI